MPALPWGRKPKPRRESNNRRHSADVGALLRSFVQPAEEAPSSMSTDLPRPSSPIARPKTSNSTQDSPNNSTQNSPKAANQDAPVQLSQDGPQRNRRFSLLRFRTASDPALGAKARAQERVPPLPEQPAPPSIITTAPTFDLTTTFPPPTQPIEQTLANVEGRLTKSTPGSSSQVNLGSATPTGSGTPNSSMRQRNGPFKAERDTAKSSRVTFDEPDRLANSLPGSPGHGPPPYDEQHNQSLPIPGPRLSESSRSTASSAEVAYTTTTTTHTVSTTTTFFRFSRKRKDTSLFPLPPKVSSDSRLSSDADTALGRANEATNRPRPSLTSTPATPRQSTSENMQPTSGTSALAASALELVSNPGQLIRSNSSASTHSTHSTPAATPLPPRFRTRSSTMSSMERAGDSGRSSLAGRNSLGGLFGLRARQTEPYSRTGSPHPYHGRSSTSQPNSLSVSRERLIIPERQDDDTPDRYLERLEAAVSKSVVATVLSKTVDDFHVTVLKRYLASFNFVRDPMDISLRKFLMEVELPKETQQIDRVLQAFADRYHDCNPLIYSSSAQAYFIVFSLLILHTDVFNKNNKNKMTKLDYTKNTRGEGVTNDVLEYFYDNISYTTFIHVEDDLDINGEKIVLHRPKRNVFGKVANESKRSREPVDPYTVIIDNKLDTLRPKLDDILIIEDPYNYLGTAHTLDMPGLHRSFFRSAVLQIVSARSRPDAFLNPATAANPQDASPGVVEIKVTKIGVLWRKDTKKKKTRSPWQEWGALLTGSQLYFFRNVNWIKNLMDQFDKHIKAGNFGIPCVFSPPMLTFNPDSFMSTDDAVALLDRNYSKHKNAFIFVKHGGSQEYLLADTESERNDWLAKLNYAAAFRTAQVRMRGVVGGHYDGQRNRSIRRLDSSNSGFRSIQTPSGEVSILSGRIDPQLAAEIASARRQVIDRKVAESEERLGTAHDILEGLIRNAHHLKMLTPLQQRTREAILASAINLAEELVTSRMEIWKLKCHRDILLMDLDEERKVDKDKLQRNLSVTTPPGTPPRTAKSPPSSAGTTPTQSIVSAALTGKRTELQRATSTVSTVSRATNTSHHSWELPPLSFDLGRGSTAAGDSSRLIGHSPLIGHGDINGDMFTPMDGRHDSTSASVNGQSEATSDDDASTIEKASNDASSAKGKDVLTATKTASNDKESKEASDRTKLRKSLQRTLRESTEGLSKELNQRRSRKSRDVSDHFPHIHTHGEHDEDKEETEGLPRSSMSFSIHGKKASVVTFGSEWQSIDPEARLARHRSGAASRMTADEEKDDILEATSLGKVVVSVDGEALTRSHGGDNTLAPADLGISLGDNSSSTRLVVVNPDAPTPDRQEASVDEAADVISQAEPPDSGVGSQTDLPGTMTSTVKQMVADAVVVETADDMMLVLTKADEPDTAQDVSHV